MKRADASRRLECLAPGCEAERQPHHGFCRNCWYRLPSAVRLAIGELRGSELWGSWQNLRAAAVEWFARNHPANDDQAAGPAVAICGLCERAAADPVVSSCTRPLCPLSARQAA